MSYTFSGVATACNNRLASVLAFIPTSTPQATRSTRPVRPFGRCFLASAADSGGILSRHSIQSNYDKTFTRLKPDKKLRWLPQLGTINITVALSDRSLTLDVTPLQASLLELFTKEGSFIFLLSLTPGVSSLTVVIAFAASWTSDDLAIELRLMDVTAVRNGLYFWSNQGVVKSGADDTWTLLEKEDKSAEQGVAHGELSRAFGVS